VFDHRPDIYGVTGTGAQPGVIPILMSRWLVGPACDIQDVGNDSFVVPAGGELGLAWLADSVSVTAATARLAVEYVGTPLRREVDVLHLRPVRGIDRIPSGTTRIGRPKHLVVLRATARLNWLGPRGRNVARRTFQLRRAEVIVGPV
jgi:hypothetical protein